MANSNNKFGERVVDTLPENALKIRVYADQIGKTRQWIYKMIKKHFLGELPYIPFEPVIFQGGMFIVPHSNEEIEKNNFSYFKPRNTMRQYRILKGKDGSLLMCSVNSHNYADYMLLGFTEIFCGNKKECEEELAELV